MFRSKYFLNCTMRRVSVTSFAGIASTLQLQRSYIGSSASNPYTILGLKQGASKEEIKRAYRIMAAKHHPDAPGGSNDKFLEIRGAYEQIKSGVWVRTDDDGAAGGGASRGDRYGGFQWYTDGKKSSKMSYDKMQEKMQRPAAEDEPVDDDDFETEEPEGKKQKYQNPLGATDEQMHAWFRFIGSWGVLFCSARLILFLLFPPHHEAAPKKALPPTPRKLPPPRKLDDSRSQRSALQ